MPRIEPIRDEEAQGQAADLLEPLRRGSRSLNVYRTLAHAPAALDAYVSIRNALSRGRFSPQLREKLAIAISTENGCDYCIPAHSAGARGLGVPPDEIEQAQRPRLDGTREDALLAIAQLLTRKRGWLADEEIERARRAGVSDADLMEVVAHVAANTLTNYANHVAQTEIDIPQPREERRASG